MATAPVNQFIHALHDLEDERQIDALLACFHRDAQLSNPHIELGPGHDAARRFWGAYRQSFNRIHSEFRHILGDDKAALLEWTSRGDTHEGYEFEYRGVSVLEFSDGLITGFRAYFDPSELGEKLEPAIKAREEVLAAESVH